MFRWLGTTSPSDAGISDFKDCLKLHNHAQLYLNLAEVYLQAGRTADAIGTLEKGLVSAGRDFRIRRALEKIGKRREPIFTFLHRSHPLNRTLGRLRHRLNGPSKAP